MPVTSIISNPDALTMTIVADYPVPVRRHWDAYADPRQIERFWGPPGWPATFTRHDMFSGGQSSYVMTGPDGERSGGYWQFLAVNEGRSFEVRNGFALDDGSPNTEMPSMRMVFEFQETAEGSRLTTTAYFNSLDEFQMLLEMGQEDGTRAAMGQIDEVLADVTSFERHYTELQLLNDTQVRINRILWGPLPSVWKAHHDAETLQRWQLGPDGWTMPVCETATAVGEVYRYEWEQEGGQGRFGFTGKVLESFPPDREVTTEQMIGAEGSTLNALTLTSLGSGTLLTLVITYPSREFRDMVLETGMVNGMEVGYSRLESAVLALD